MLPFREGDARIIYVVIPAKAGIHWLLAAAKWIPAFAGMTRVFWEAVAHFGISAIQFRYLGHSDSRT
jgi:hypothetical protein